MMTEKVKESVEYVLVGNRGFVLSVFDNVKCIFTDTMMGGEHGIIKRIDRITEIALNGDIVISHQCIVIITKSHVDAMVGKMVTQSAESLRSIDQRQPTTMEYIDSLHNTIYELESELNNCWEY